MLSHEFTWLKVEDHIQRLSIIRYLFVQTSQIKLVLNVVFIDLLIKLYGDIKYFLLCYFGHLLLTSQKNSLPRSPQNHEIHETSSELLMFAANAVGTSTIEIEKGNKIVKSPTQRLYCSVKR